MTVSVQLNIDTARCDLGDLAGRHQVQQTQAQDLGVVHAQLACYPRGELVLLRGRVPLPARKLAKRMHRAPAFVFARQVEQAWNRIGSAVEPPAVATPKEITQHQVKDWERMVGVVGGLIDRGGKTKLAQHRESNLMEVMKAIVKGDHDSPGGESALAEHSQRFVERQDAILAPSQSLQALAEEGGLDEEVSAPLVLVFQREAVVAKNEQALPPPAAARYHFKHTKTSGDPQSVVLQKLQHGFAGRCIKHYDFTWAPTAATFAGSGPRDEGEVERGSVCEGSGTGHGATRLERSSAGRRRCCMRVKSSYGLHSRTPFPELPPAEAPEATDASLGWGLAKPLSNPEASNERDRLLCWLRRVCGAELRRPVTGGFSVATRLAAAAEACRMILDEDCFARVLSRLGPQGQPERAFHLLSQITMDPASSAAVARLCASIPSEACQNAVERTLLMLASQHAIAQVPGLAVSDRVKELFADEFQFFANPPSAWVASFQADHVRYREMARIATLRRFPAGQFHWEVARFPGTWAAKARQPWRVLRAIQQMRGRGPLLELHLNDRRECRPILLEEEANFSYCRAARSIEKQPAVRGLMGASWLNCESTARVTPHLAWVRRTFQSAGASLIDLGPAPADSGFLTGSKERRKLYEQGAYRPNVTCVLWPRKSLIKWANQHPEFDL